jgi:hypothetical protein
VGTCCPWCDWVLYPGELLSGLVWHVLDCHPGVQVQGLVLGNPYLLQTNRGPVALWPAERPDL